MEKRREVMDVKRTREEKNQRCKKKMRREAMDVKREIREKLWMERRKAKRSYECKEETRRGKLHM